MCLSSLSVSVLPLGRAQGRARSAQGPAQATTRTVEDILNQSYLYIYIYTSSSMVPLRSAYGPLRGGILGGSRGGKSTSEGRWALWVYFKPKRGAR